MFNLLTFQKLLRILLFSFAVRKWSSNKTTKTYVAKNDNDKNSVSGAFRRSASASKTTNGKFFYCFLSPLHKKVHSPVRRGTKTCWDEASDLLTSEKPNEVGEDEGGRRRKTFKGRFIVKGHQRFTDELQKVFSCLENYDVAPPVVMLANANRFEFLGVWEHFFLLILRIPGMKLNDASVCILGGRTPFKDPY